MIWRPGQTVFQEQRTPEERLHGKAGRLRKLTVTRVDATGRAFIEDAGYFDYLGMPLDYYGVGIVGDSIAPWSATLEARLTIQQRAKSCAS